MVLKKYKMETFINLEQLDDFQPFAGLRAKVVHTDKQTFAFWTIDSGSSLPSHHHPQAQVTMVTSGTLEMTVDGETQTLTQGMVAIIPPHSVHSAIAHTEVKVIDVFTPQREDLK